MTWRGPRDGFFRHSLAFGRRRDGRRGLAYHLRTRLLVGALVAFPLVVTIFFGRFMFGMLDRWFRPISRELFGVTVHGAGMILFLLALYLLGVLATNVLGSRALQLLERWIARLPGVGPIYQGARKITEAFQLRGSEHFRRVVLVEFPGPGLHSIGFVTREQVLLRPGEADQPLLVFVPTTPNPTTGFLVAVSRDAVVPLDLSVEEAAKTLISGGLLTPDRLSLPTGRERQAEAEGEPLHPDRS